MNPFINSLLFCLLLSVVSSRRYSLTELKNIFQRELCIEGPLDTLYLKQKEKTEDDTRVESILNLTSVGTIEEFEKPILSRLNELAHYHQIDYYFKLEKEEGPSHQKLFIVSLYLGKEIYLGEGTSLKKAKKDAAYKAFEKTEYELIEIKKKTVNDIEKLTPTVLLNNLGSKLGIGVTYYLVDKDKEEILHSNIVLTEKDKNYLKKLNDSIYLDKNLKMKKDIDSIKGPFHIKLKFGEHIFHSTSHSIQLGRHEVASKALDFLAKNQNSLDFPCLKEGSEEECKKNKDQLKSPISKVYEEAQKRKLDIEFEIVNESGPSHKRSFVTECRLGNIKTVGEGFSKKESKRNAAVNMLEEIKEMDPLPIELEIKDSNIKKKQKRKKNKVIKTRLDDINLALDSIGKSVVGLANNIFGNDYKAADDSVGNIKEKNYDNKDSKPKQKAVGKNTSKKSLQNELLELSNVLNFKLAFTDFNDENTHISLLSLYINPEYTCFGEDKTEFLARNNAAKNGLELLNKIGVYDIFTEQKEALLEREIKEEIRTIIDPRISEEKEEL